MDIHRPIDIYCERLGPGLWAEPLNFVTNLVFIAAGALGVMWLRRRYPREAPRSLWALCVIAFAIGIGSGLFHSVATPWAMAADVIPIVVFLLFYLGVLTRQVFRWSWPAVGLSFGAFGVVSAACATLVPRELVGGSNVYFGADVALWAAGIYAMRIRLPQARLYLAAAACFAFSLAFRSIDMKVCEVWPIGTHFMWHLLNGTVIGLTLRAAIGAMSAERGDDAEMVAPMLDA